MRVRHLFKADFFNLILLNLIFICSCSPAPKVDLYTVLEIFPKIIEPGDMLTIEGEGFVEGPAHILLNGTVKPIGLRPPKQVSRHLEGFAVSESKIEVPISAYLMETITQETVQFEGIARVSFPSKLQESAVALQADSPTTKLEFRPTGGGVRIQALKIREAEHLMKQLGMTTSSRSSEEVITITRIAQGSFAASNHIPAGAKLIAIDGFPLLSIEELAGLELQKDHIFEFVYPNGVSKQIPLNIGANELKDDQFAAILLTSIAMGFFLAFVLPRYTKKGAIPKLLPRNPVTFILGYTTAAILTILFPALVILWKLNIFGTVFLVALFVICAILFLFYNKQPLPIRLLNTVGTIATITAVALMGGAAGNTMGTFDIVVSQSTAHFDLHVWKNPLMMLGTVIAISSLWPKHLVENAPSFLHITAWIMSICGAMTIVFFCLGGWIIPGIFTQSILDSPTEMVAAIFIFAVKTWLVLLAARSIAGINRHDRRQQAASLSYGIQFRGFLLLGLATGAIYLEFATVPQDIQFAGQILSAAIFFTLVSLLLFSRLSWFDKNNKVILQA